MSSSSAPGAWWWPLLVELPLAAAKLVGAVPGGGSFPGGIPGTAWLMSVALPCAAWAEPLWAVSTGSWGAFGVAGAALKGVLLLSVAFWLMSFNFWFLWLNIFFIFWSGPSVSSLISVRQLYSFHKSHYNWCQATAWPCSSCADLQARESRDGDFTPVQGVHPGKHQVYNLLSCIFPKLRSRA